MGRVPAKKVERKDAPIIEALIKYGLPRGFAVDVAQTIERDGPGAALVHLYAGGWEVVKLKINGVEQLSIQRSLSMQDGNGGKDGKDKGEKAEKKKKAVRKTSSILRKS